MNQEQFEEFFAFMRPKLVRYALRRLDADRAGEVAIHALQSLWTKNLDAPRDDIEFRQLQSLSYRLVEGHINNLLRSELRQARLVNALVDQQQTRSQVEPDVAEQFVSARVPELTGALDKLSLSDREVLLLLRDGYKVAEIAIILDCSPGAAGMRLRRAKDNLKLLIGRGHTHDAHDG